MVYVANKKNNFSTFLDESKTILKIFICLRADRVYPRYPLSVSVRTKGWRSEFLLPCSMTLFNMNCAKPTIV